MTSSHTDTAEPILDVRGLHHVYGSGPGAYIAIEEITFDVREGEIVSIVGPSGAGKTTLLRSLAGLLRPSQGELALSGTRITSVPAGMAMVFQDYSRSLLPWLTVRKNIEFPLDARAGSSEQRAALVNQSIQAVGLAGHEHKHPWQLSGGMQQRVAIARALAYRPRLLLMDEPFASVDAQTRSDLEDLVLRIREEFGMTILFVTHDIDESVYLADRVLVLSRPPARVAEIVHVDLPRTRDQITTKERPEFVRTRSHIARLIRGEN